MTDPGYERLCRFCAGAGKYGSDPELLLTCRSCWGSRYADGVVVVEAGGPVPAQIRVAKQGAHVFYAQVWLRSAREPENACTHLGFHRTSRLAEACGRRHVAEKWSRV